ncbi:hypothetical protein Bbelb_184260 [Branchiostoma belcheri]|nr:hypothetical protein Bbelb_184260 [Branchiostoma belcheri]
MRHEETLCEVGQHTGNGLCQPPYRYKKQSRTTRWIKLLSLGVILVDPSVPAPCTVSHDGNPRIVVTTTSDPIVRSFSGGSEEDFPPSKVNRRRRRKWEHERTRRSTFPGQYSQADGSTERRVQTRSIAPLEENTRREADFEGRKSKGSFLETLKTLSHLVG